VPHHEDVWGSGGITPQTQPWHEIEMSGQLHPMVTLPSEKETLVPTGQEAVLAPALVWM